MMRISRVVVIVAIVALAGCKGTRAAPRENREICQRALDRYNECMKLDADSRHHMQSNVDHCTADEETVFQKCLATKSCPELMACLLAHASSD